MNVEIGTEASQLAEEEYRNGIFVAMLAAFRKFEQFWLALCALKGHNYLMQLKIMALDLAQEVIKAYPIISHSGLLQAKPHDSDSPVSELSNIRYISIVLLYLYQSFLYCSESLSQLMCYLIEKKTIVDLFKRYCIVNHRPFSNSVQVEKYKKTTSIGAESPQWRILQ